MAAAIVTFVLCLGIVVGGYWALIVRPEGAAARSLRKRLATRSERPRKTEVTKNAPPLSAVKVLDSLLARSGLMTRPLQQLITLSGLTLTVGTVLLASVLAAILTFLAVRALVSAAWLGLVLAAIVAPSPVWFVRLCARRRLQRFEEQFPEAIDLIAVSLRAGHSFPTALLIVAEETAPPLATEFRQIHDEQNYGKPTPDVLKGFADRVPLLDVPIFVTAVLTQREVGGNLAEVLDKLSGVIRERFMVRRQVRVVSAHGRITGWVLTVPPPAVAMILYSVAPDHVMTLIRDPLGQQITVAAITMQLIGTLAIRRIVRIEI